MTARQSRHPDNDLIDSRRTETPGQSGSAGGNLQRDVGKRAEEHHVRDEDPRVERLHKADEGKREPPRSKTNRQ
jgi:hypothetical protein